MSMTREQIEANNARVEAEEALYAKLTPEERRRRMQSKALGKKSPIIMDAFKRLGLITEKPNENPTRPEIPNTKPQRDKAPALGQAIQREAKGILRTTVRFIGYRVRPLDPDNFAGSVKDCLDGLRHARLIEGDEPWRIILETEQHKVATFKEERTEIEITIP